MQKNELQRLDSLASRKHRRLESSMLRRLYRVLAGFLRIGELGRQRWKTVYFAWGYWRILRIGRLSVRERVELIGKLLRVDWHVIHGHRPAEIAVVAEILASKPAVGHEVMVEAGCWRGGSSAKFSILCQLFGYRLQIYDSFEGVESLDDAVHSNEWHFGGQYACPEDIVRMNVMRFGTISVCEFHKGWFSETLARSPVAAPVQLAYIDCDLAKGTLEVLQGVMPSISEDGCILSQDFHITPVRRLLLDPETWSKLGVGMPNITSRSVYMAQLDWRRDTSRTVN